MNGVAYRIAKDFLFKAVVVMFAFAAIAPLVFILFYLFKKGISEVSWSFLTTLPKPPGETGGGISNALVGTVLLIFFSALFSIPIGVAAGIYLSEFKNARFADMVRLCVDILQGIPSIVIGIVAYAWVVKKMGGFSLLSGSAALGMMMLPIIIKSAEETLNLIPQSLREASLALGVPYHRTVLKVIVPSGLSGILTGILLATARVSGETAPLLFTAFGNPFMSVNPGKPVNSLPLLIFNYAASPYREWHALAWGASVILILMVLLLNVLVRFGTRKWKIQF